MSSQPPLAAEVLVTAEVSIEEEQAIIEAFLALGVVARTRLVPTRRGLEQLQWLVLAALPLHAFLSGLGSAAAQEVAQSFKRLVLQGQMFPDLRRCQLGAPCDQAFLLDLAL